MTVEVEAACKEIAACRERGDGVLDLGGLGLDDAAVRELLPEIIKLPPLEVLWLGLAHEAREKAFDKLTDEDKAKRNKLQTIPTELISAHSQLKRLDLAFNQMTALPRAIGGVTALEVLRLDGNHLTDLPEAIGGVTALKGLWLDGNHLTDLPEAVGSLTALQVLSLSKNQLKALPEAVSRLTALQSLWLDDNQLTELPEAIGGLTALQSLWLEGNHLTDLPEAIGGLTALQNLSLSKNQLKALPEAIGGLTALQSLWLRDNQLRVLPEAIGGLTALQNLSLSKNQLKALPEAVSRLTALQSLWLHENQLRVLPEAIGGLTALQELSLAKNQLKALPEAIGGLTALQSLWLDENELRVLPEAIGGLTALQNLSLSKNQLKALPEAIGGLTALQSLWLDGNHLTDLPEAVGSLTALNLLSMHENPLTYPPTEIVDQGAEAIVNFLAGVRADGQPLHEAKVVLLGDPAHGKTALRSWLEHDRFVEPAKSTRGGEVGFREIDVGGAKGRINLWDFGGQHRYRPAQQPLFTPGALYLLVCNGRLNILESGVPEWLRLIQLRAGRDARVLLVFTHTGPHDGIPSLTPLQNELRQMIKEGDIFAIDSPSGFAVQKLLDRICEEALSLPRFHNKWPGSYIRARNDVLALGPPCGEGKGQSYVPYSRFLEICEAHNVSGASARSLATALSLQGRLDYEGTEVNPDQLVVLDPGWLLKAIAYVIDDKSVAARGGILHHRELRARRAVTRLMQRSSRR